MYAELLLAFLLVSSLCAVGLAIVAVEYIQNLKVREAVLMKYGVVFQIGAFVVLGVLRLGYTIPDTVLNFIPVFTLLGAGIFMLGALNVAKVLGHARLIFTALSLALQLCVVGFLTVTACLIP